MKIVNVRTTSELLSVLSKNESADIRLAAGTYGNLDFNPNSTAPIARGAVEFRISSADASRPAVFEHFKVSGIKNVTIDNVTFDYRWESWNNSTTNAFSFKDVQNLTIENSRFIGDTLPSSVTNLGKVFNGHGLKISGATNLVLDDNDFTGFLKGVIIDYSKNVDFTNNEVHNVRSDGLSFGRVNDVLVKGNYFHSFFPVAQLGDHPDMLVVAETGSGRPTSGLTIVDNVFNARNDNSSQTIYINNPNVSRSPGDKSQYFTDIEIANNLIVNNHINGIWVGPSHGVTVNNNTMLSHIGPGGSVRGPVEVPAIVMFNSNYDFDIFKNVTFKVMYDGSDKSGIRDNLFIQPLDKLKSGFYDQYFSDYILAPGTDELPTLRPGTTLTKGGYGVDGTPNVTSSPVTPTPPKPGTPPSGALIGVGLTEAEDLELAGYVESGWTGSTGSGVVQLSQSGVASGVFDGAAGTYRVSVRYVNEDDGAATWRLLVDSQVMASWTGTGGSNNFDTFQFVTKLEKGDVLGIAGERGQGELARIDSVRIESASGVGTPPTLSGPSIGVGRTEAEDLSLSGYAASAASWASGGALIETDKAGSASGVFTGPSGRYAVSVSYLDEFDGRAGFRLVVDGQEEARWTANVTGSGNVARTFKTTVDIAQGDEIEIFGTRDLGEFARIDSILIDALV